MQVAYFNLYTHFVLTTYHRLPLISSKIKGRIEKYIYGIIANHGCKMYAICANPEHVHILISRSPVISENELIEKIAWSTMRFINEKKLISENFAWQESCSAFSISKSGVDDVCKYIQNQLEHHKKVSYNEEYESFMRFYQQTLNAKE